MKLTCNNPGKRKHCMAFERYAPSWWPYRCQTSCFLLHRALRVSPAWLATFSQSLNCCYKAGLHPGANWGRARDGQWGEGTGGEDMATKAHDSKAPLNFKKLWNPHGKDSPAKLQTGNIHIYDYPFNRISRNTHTELLIYTLQSL